MARFYLLLFFFSFDFNDIYGRGVTWHSTGGEEAPEGPPCPAPLVLCSPSILTCSHQLFFPWREKEVNFSRICLIFSCFEAFFSSCLLLRILYFIGHWGSGRLAAHKCSYFPDGLFTRHLKCCWPSELLLMQSLHSEIFCLKWNWCPSNN